MLVRAQITVGVGQLADDADGPRALVELLTRRGAKAFQLRDVDGVFGSSELPPWLASTIEAAGTAPVQLDAALADSQAIERATGLGFDSVVISMRALFEPMQLRWALDLLDRRLVVELQADGDYLFDPPAGAFGMELREAVRQLHFQGVRHVLIRDVTALEVPLTRLQDLGGNLGMDITYQGPVRTLDDIRELTMLDPRHFHAVVIGEALLTGELDIARATEIAGGTAE